MYKESHSAGSAQPLPSEIIANINENTNFIFKAFAIVNDPSYLSLIHWSKSGSSFIIENIEEFQRVVLPKHFRHNRYQSFVRQLNMYDFHKIRNGDHYSENKAEFRHEGFVRDGLEQLVDIKRKGFKEKQVGGSKNNTNSKKKSNRKKNHKKCKPINKLPSLSRIKRVNHKVAPVPQEPVECSIHQEEDEMSENYHSSEDNSFFHKMEDNSRSILAQKRTEAALSNTKQLENFINRVVEEIAVSKPIRSMHKLSERIKLAENIKQKWQASFVCDLLSHSDLETMKKAYFQIKRKLLEMEDSTEMTHEDKQNCLGLTDIGEEENLINSIFKTEIKSTLIYINSETFINNHGLGPNRTFMAI